MIIRTPDQNLPKSSLQSSRTNTKWFVSHLNMSSNFTILRCGFKLKLFLISRLKLSLDFPVGSKKSFFIAPISPVFLFLTASTDPYAPSPRCFTMSYLLLGGSPIIIDSTNRFHLALLDMLVFTAEDTMQLCKRRTPARC